MKKIYFMPVSSIVELASMDMVTSSLESNLDTEFGGTTGDNDIFEGDAKEFVRFDFININEE